MRPEIIIMKNLSLNSILWGACPYHEITHVQDVWWIMDNFVCVSRTLCHDRQYIFSLLFLMTSWMSITDQCRSIVFCHFRTQLSFTLCPTIGNPLSTDVSMMTSKSSSHSFDENLFPLEFYPPLPPPPPDFMNLTEPPPCGLLSETISSRKLDKADRKKSSCVRTLRLRT